MTAPKLPPLPAIPLPNGYPVEQHGVIAKFAQDYSRAAQRIALEDAAKVCLEAKKRWPMETMSADSAWESIRKMIGEIGE